MKPDRPLFESEEEKLRRLHEEWKKNEKKGYLRGRITEVCAAAGAVIGLLAAVAVEMIFRDELPKVLTARLKGRPGRSTGSIIEAAGMFLGAYAGWLLAKLLIRARKLEEQSGK